MSMAFINEEHVTGTLLERNKRMMEMMLNEKKAILQTRHDPLDVANSIYVLFQYTRNSNDSVKEAVGESIDEEQSMPEDNI